MRQVRDDQHSNQFAALQANRESAAAEGIIRRTDALRLQRLTLELGRRPCAQRAAFRQADGVELAMHPLLIADRGILRAILEDGVTIQLADADRHVDSPIKHPLHEKCSQFPCVTI